MDHAEQWPPTLDERDIDGELAIAAEEFLGPVERVDQPEALLGKALARWQAAERGSLLGDDWDARQQSASAGTMIASAASSAAVTGLSSAFIRADRAPRYAP